MDVFPLDPFILPPFFELTRREAHVPLLPPFVRNPARPNIAMSIHTSVRDLFSPLVSDWGGSQTTLDQGLTRPSL